MAATVPIIDIAPLLDGSAAGERQVAAAIGPVARTVGFFYIANHGVPAALTDAVLAQAGEFFARPLAEKRAVSQKLSKSNTGYLAIGDEVLHADHPPDAKESFHVNREIADDDPDYRAGKPFVAPNQWLPDMPAFRRVMLDYFATQKLLCEQLHRAFALDLGLDADFFAPFIDQPLATLRLLHYPPHPGAFDGRQYGAAPHTDYGNLTTLLQDDRGGLQVRARDGGWIDALPVPGTLLCNIGDCLMRWSNDTYVSTPHRVVNRSGNDRYSAAFFHDPNYDAEVACLSSCTGPGRPARYPPITGGAYLTEKIREAFGYAGA
jgi:isopenicillin N synthase-like dioxygenase